MKTFIFTPTIILSIFMFNCVSAQNIGVGEYHPGSRLSVKGGLAIGNDYSTLASPSSGAIIEGPVGIGTTTPDPNALMDFQSTSKGVLLPRLTSAQRNAIQSPSTGLLVFDSDSNSFYYYNGIQASWVKMISDGSTSSIANATPITGQPATASNNSKWIFIGTDIQVSGGSTYNNISITNATHLNFVENTRAGTFVISGITGGTDGQMIILENDDNNNGQMILSASGATNGISIPNKDKSSRLTVAAGNSITLIFDGKKGSWKVINWQN